MRRSTPDAVTQPVPAPTLERDDGGAGHPTNSSAQNSAKSSAQPHSAHGSALTAQLQPTPAQPRLSMRQLARGWEHATLRAKLVAGVVLLFFGVTLLTGAASLGFTNRYLSRQLAAELQASSMRGPRPNNARLPDLHGGMLRLVLSTDGEVATTPSGQPLNSVDDPHQTLLTDSQVTYLWARTPKAPHSARLEIPELGPYLVTARTTGPNQMGAPALIAIVGLPTTRVDETVTRLMWQEVAGLFLGLTVVISGGTYLIRRTLEPLDRVAATARDVADSKLASGDIAPTPRVPRSDTDPHTEVGQVGLALNHLLDNVESALQARQESETRVRQFVADASHELRTPLASIRGYTELSHREREPIPDSIRHALGRVESEALRMQELVEDLLLLARLDSGRPLAHDRVDVTQLAIDTLSDAHAASPEHQWRLDVPDEPVEIMGDRSRLQQVMVNLLANARVHTPAGTMVTLSVRQDRDAAHIIVADTGPGIPEALQRNVFQRFTRGDDSRNRASGSTGLGLSIVDAVVTAHGGRVQLSSQPGCTVFTVVLPATTPHHCA